ncbi:MAG: molybdopterin-dependent oxidoreductase [Acetobacterium sp.]|uniref:molybdopterin-containing oxidoreductase family protein n=1 Tax=Acetobacterium sp. TaxID=1872094 RepID=UPI003242F605
MKRFQDHSDRLDYPLKKVGDHFERITWEQAYKEISERANQIIEQYGPRSCAMVGGATPGSQAELVFARAMMSAIGSQYQYNAIGIEFCGSWWSHGKIFGDQMHFLEPDDDNCEVLMFWGSNSYVSGQILNAREKIRSASQNPDRQVIVVDPRLSETARISDMHIMLRSGTDALLLRAMIALIIKKGWQDQNYLDKYVKDFQLVKPWFKDVDIKEAIRVCGLPYEQVEAFCKILTTKKWGVHQDLGLFMGRHNTLNSYLLLTLAVVTGVALMPGGCIVNDCVVTRGKSIDENDPKVWRTVETNRFPIMETYPSAVLAQEILSEKPEHLRLIFCSASNPLRSYPDTNAMEKAMRKLDLLVTVDVCMTETARISDYVLPVKSTYETYDFNAFQMNYPEMTAQIKHPVITKQIGERKEGGQIWIEMPKALGKMPQLPDRLYKVAEKAVQKNDRIAFFRSLILYTIKNKVQVDLLPAVVGEVLGKYMGSPTKAVFWAAMMTSPIAGSGMVERAGIKPNGKHPIMEKLPKMKDICVMDAAYQLLLDRPEGAVIGKVDPDTMINRHIVHKDKKIHLYCDEINEYIKRITPEKEAEILNGNQEFPMVLSSGNHTDYGVNIGMRNPATYKYHNPYKLAVHPDDAKQIGVSEGQEVTVTTKAGSIKIPVEYTWQTSPGYVLVPHHFGIEFNGQKIGQSANTLSHSEDLDELTGNPMLRHIRCRIEPSKTHNKPAL